MPEGCLQNAACVIACAVDAGSSKDKAAVRGEGEVWVPGDLPTGGLRVGEVALRESLRARCDRGTRSSGQDNGPDLLNHFLCSFQPLPTEKENRAVRDLHGVDF